MNANHYNPKKLIEWRESLGKTQENIAEILGVDRNTISRAETGKVASFHLLAELCSFYKKSTHDLIYSTPVTAIV